MGMVLFATILGSQKSDNAQIGDATSQVSHTGRSVEGRGREN